MQNTRIDYVLKMIAKIERKLNCNNISVRINKYKSPITIGVYISKEDKNPLDLLEELLRFPNAAHDDQVDAMTMAIHYMKESWHLEHPEDPEWDDPPMKKKVAYWRT